MSSKQRSMRFNILVNNVRVIMNIIFPIITFPYASRVLMADGIGKVSFANSIVMVFIVLGSAGIPTYGIREVAKSRNDKASLTKLTHELFLLNFALSVISMIAYILMVALNPAMNKEIILFLVVGTRIILTPLGIEWFYQGIEDYLYITMRSIFVQIASVVLLFLLVRKNTDYISYAAITVISLVAVNFFNFFNLRKHISTKFYSISKYNFKVHLKPISILFALNIATTLYENFDTTLLGLLKNTTEVGYYSTANKLMRMSLTIIISVSTVLLPRMSFYLKNNMYREFNKTIGKSLKMLLMLSIPISILLVLLSKEVILIMGGENFLPARTASVILAPEVVVLAVSNLIGVQVLITLGRERITLIACVLGAIIDILANIILVPMLGNVGTAISNLLAQITALIVQFLGAKDYVKEHLFDKQNLRYFIAGFLMIPFVLYARGIADTSIISFFISSIVGCIVYAIVLFIKQDDQFMEIAKWFKLILTKFITRIKNV